MSIKKLKSTTIIKSKTTNNFHPALGKLFIIKLSNGKLFEIYSEELINKFCYNDGYDDDKIAKMESKDFVDVIGERWD